MLSLAGLSSATGPRSHAITVLGCRGTAAGTHYPMTPSQIALLPHRPDNCLCHRFTLGDQPTKTCNTSLVVPCTADGCASPPVIPFKILNETIWFWSNSFCLWIPQRCSRFASGPGPTACPQLPPKQSRSFHMAPVCASPQT